MKNLSFFLFAALTISLIVILFLSYNDNRIVKEKLIKELTLLNNSDQIVIRSYKNGVCILDTAKINYVNYIEAKKDLELVSNKILDNNTIGIIFTIFSLALLSAGIYILTVILSKIKEMDLLFSESTNIMLNLSVNQNIDGLLFIANNLEIESSTMIEYTKPLLKALNDRNLLSLNTYSYNILTKKLRELIRKVEDFKNNTNQNPVKTILEKVNNDLSNAIHIMEKLPKSTTSKLYSKENIFPLY